MKDNVKSEKVIEEYPKVTQSSDAKQSKNVKRVTGRNNRERKMQISKDVQQRKKRKQYRRGRRISVSTWEVCQWFSKGPIDRYVRSSSVRLLLPSNQSLHHRISRLRTLSRSPCGANVGLLHSFKAASRHALGDWEMCRDCALQLGKTYLTVSWLTGSAIN